jgi:hypothetical protein
MIYRFRFWKEWCDEQGRFWAEPLDFDSAVDARKAHRGAMSWHWVGDKVRPSVSDLYSVAFKEDPQTGKKREENRTVIQDGAHRDYYEATLPDVRTASERPEVPHTRGVTPPAAKPSAADTPF